MMINRRTLLAAAPALAVWPALAKEKEKDAPAALHAPLQAYERDTGGRIGVYAENLKTGAKIAWRANERFVMCSTFKASLAACVLARIDRGEDKPDQMISYAAADLLQHAPVARENLAKGALSVADMCKAIVEVSDNACANMLLARVGGPAALTAFWNKTGDSVSRLDHNEPLLNRSRPGNPQDTTTPAAMAGNVKRFITGNVLTPASRDQLIDWMVNCKTGDKRLRAGLPKAWKIGDKTGNNGKDAAGDIAVTWPKPDQPVVIAAYTQGGTPTAAQLETVFKAIGELVGRQLG
ncbi:class A beta-lactamase [Tardiphaga sp. 768_D3_N2_1]|uniref:class A beta-lactamase n=1 Tax=Tardiphaga sp. 768_D3_N2_1 TaxID=3240783 RepID=UPI003F88CF56